VSRWLKGWHIFALVALVSALVITRMMAAQPGGFTDVFYHFNAANRLISGQGFTDAYLWVYVGMPDSLPAPSHLYWLPLTSVLAAAGMWLFNAPGHYSAAQVPFALLLAGAAGTGYWLGGRLGGTGRHAWLAGLITLSGGFFMRFWGATDTFAPFALFGSLCLVFMGLLFEASGRRVYMWAALVGALAGLGHLTRADGPLLLLVGWAVVLWPWDSKPSWGQPLLRIVWMTLAYVLVMSPWFMRNLDVIGSPLPVGGVQAMWFTTYDDLFNYPPQASPQTFFAGGIGLLFSTRWEAFTANLQTFIAVEGMIVLTPLMLVGLWQRRRDRFLRGFWLYALGLHIVMTLVFPFPGYRGGLFHSAAALLPWWAALGVAGLDDVVGWAGRRRRWHVPTAKRVFSGALLVFVLFLSLSIALPRRVTVHTPELYTLLADALPPDARVMINDPMQLYYYTGRGGVVLPNEDPAVIPEIAGKYGIGYLLLETQWVDGQRLVAASPKLAGLVDDPPEFLTRLNVKLPDGVILYAIDT
jgi:hypothetical protein